jgi:hypothetical protein
MKSLYAEALVKVSLPDDLSFLLADEFFEWHAIIVDNKIDAIKKELIFFINFKLLTKNKYMISDLLIIKKCLGSMIKVTHAR